MRTIWHLDLDSFFVSAERLRAPQLRGRPVAVGGHGARAVISSASYEARRFGVRSAMPVSQALRLCPTLIVVAPDFELYSSLSKAVFSLLPEYTPLHECVSIDEAYLDMTGSESLFGKSEQAAARLRGHIFEHTGLSASIGVASNRLVAKVASDQCKPDNFLVIPPGKEAEFLAPLDVSKLPGCGRVTTKWLLERGIRKVAELQRYPLDVLERHLGKFGTYLHDSSWGRGSVEFHEEAKTRSISREITFDHDVSEAKELKANLWSMVAELGQSLRSENVYARAIRLKLRYPPFETITRSRVLATPTQADNALFEAALNLFDEHWEVESAVRLLGVGCVLGDGAHQLDLFTSATPTSNFENLDLLKDAIRARFGANALFTGRDR